MKKTLKSTKYLQKGIFALVSCLFPHVLFSQVNQQWVQRYNGLTNGYDFAQGIAIDPSGNVYVTGRSRNTSNDYTTIKYNAGGVLQWVRVYDGPANSTDEASAIVVDPSGNVYVTGRSEGTGTSFDFATVKYSTDGVLQWVQRYNGLGNNLDYGVALALDGVGNLYVTGASYGIEQNFDYVTIKYDVAGATQWVQRYNGPANRDDGPAGLSVDHSGNVYVTGGSTGITGSSGGVDFATIKYSASGIQQWVQRFDRLAGDAATAIALDLNDNVYVTGWSFNSGGTTLDYTTIKYNSQGTQQWVQFYDGSGHNNDEPNAIATDAMGNAYITGASFGSGNNFDYVTIKYNTAGLQQWVQVYDGPAHGTDNAADLAVDALGNVYVTGFSSSGSGSFADYVTIKYNTTGTQQWLISYNGTANDGDQATAIAVDNLGNAYVTGGSVSVAPGANYDYATIKYSPPLVVNAGSDITVNFGFGSNCTHLTATASGGSLPYRYAWVPGGSDPAGQSTIVCPTKTTSYVVTVTDANNNTAADEVVVNVTDVRCGADSTKVIICHKGQSLCVSASAVKVHLQHGDQLGNCPEIRTTSQSNKISTEFTAGLSLSNYPNPFSTETKIVYFLPFDSKVSLKVYDVTGKEIAILVQWPQKAGTYSFDFKSAGFSKGVYYYRITAASGKQYLDITKKMMIVK